MIEKFMIVCGILCLGSVTIIMVGLAIYMLFGGVQIIP